ncbi:MAG: hypothetical protein AB7G75_27100 [Candidatus Binatia bacterium]
MNTQFLRTKTTAGLALATLAFTVATTSAAFAAKPLFNKDVSQTGVLIGGGGGGGGQDLGPDDPFSKPRIPGQPTLVESKENSLQLQWKDNSSYEQGYNLYRGPSYSGPWTLIAVFGAAPGNSETMQYIDAGLPRDSGYYYRVGAYNFYGESFSLPQAFATIDGRKVSRLRLRIRTANVPDANTNDDVHVSLRDNDNGGTWLNYGRDDFERGDEFTYELLLHDIFDGIQDLSEINHIYLLKPGDDGWCIESLTLVADTRNGVDNGVEIFTQDFGPTASTCRWLDGQQNYLVIGRDTLRAHPLWQAYKQPDPPLALHPIDLERRIEGTVGHIIHAGTYVDASPFYMGTLDVSWAGGPLDGESYVKVSKKDEQAVHVQFNLDVNTPGPGGLTGGLSFDLRFAGECRTEKTICDDSLTYLQPGDGRLPSLCRTETTPATIKMTMENIAAAADFDWTTEAMTLWLINLAEDDIADRITASFPDFSQTITVDNEKVSCVTPSVASDGTVDFIPTITPRTTTGGTKTTGTGTFGKTKTSDTITRGTEPTGTKAGGTKATGTVKTPTSKIFAE